MLRMLLSTILCLLPAFNAAAQRPVFLDGLFSDWSDKTPQGSVYAIAPAEPGEFEPEGSTVTVTHNATHLLIRVTNTTEFDIQENNDLRLLIDADGNPGTGTTLNNLQISGIELIWRFGGRNGAFYPAGGGNSVSLFHEDIGLITAPTTTSESFEIAVALDATPDGNTPLFSGGSITVWIARDQLSGMPPPDFQPITYNLEGTPLETPSLRLPQLPRPGTTDLRLVSYNVLFESFENSDNHPAYGRILAALDPDIISFQEIVEFNGAAVRNIVAQYIDPLPGGSWHQTQNSDLRLVSRYPILLTWQLAIEGQGSGNQAVLLDTEAEFGENLLVIQCHLPFGEQEQERQNEVDQIMAFIRDQRLLDDDPGIDETTPVVILGDLNLVGLRQQLTTLLDGDIQDTTTHGDSFLPDRDGSSLTAAHALHLADPVAYTWINTSGSFYPGILDFQIYTDSILKARNAFVFEASDLSAVELGKMGLQADDTSLSDHFPVVVDYEFWPEGSLIAELLETGTAIEGGWLADPVLGLFYPVESAWVYHPSAGMVYIYRFSDRNDAWLYFPQFGWLWTGRNFFPYFYDLTNVRWLFLDTSEGAPKRRFYDFEAQAWIDL